MSPLHRGADPSSASPWAAATSIRDPRAASVGVGEPERGLPGWAAVGILVAIAAGGAGIDGLTGSSKQLAFNWGIVLAAAVAIFLVRRTAMFWVVVAPPLVYFAISAITLYFSNGELKKNLYSAAANWLVYGFPAIAGATAVVLIVAGMRIINRR